MSRRPPICSVIIPTHNRCALAVRAIDSVLSSTLDSDLQVIVVDDASTDDTLAVLHERYGHDARVRVLHTASNEGPSGARNRGLAEATGDFVIFLDSDDTLLPSALAYAQAAFQQVPELQFLTLEGEAASIDRHDRRQRIVREGNAGWRAEGFDASRLQHRAIEPPAGIDGPSQKLEFGDLLSAALFGDLFWLSGLVIRRHAALAAGSFDMRYRNLEDWDFTARLCLTGAGGYLDHVGFHRETGHSDQLSKAGSRWLTAQMHQHVLANVRATGRMEGDASRQRLLRRAQAAADYCLGRCLLEQPHHGGRARAYLMQSLRQAYKPLKTLVWLAAGEPIARISRYRRGRRE